MPMVQEAIQSRNGVFRQATAPSLPVEVLGISTEHSCPTVDGFVNQIQLPGKSNLSLSFTSFSPYSLNNKEYSQRYCCLHFSIKAIDIKFGLHLDWT